MNVNRLITFLICFVFIGQAQADKPPVEIWECSKDGTVIVKAKVFKGKSSGSIEVSGVTRETTFEVDGFNRRWNFGYKRFGDEGYGYALLISPTGDGSYYEFREPTAKPSLRMSCYQDQALLKVKGELYREQQRLKKLKADIQKEAKRLKKDRNKRLLSQEIQAETDKERRAIRQSQIEALKVSYINQIAARVKDHWRYAGAKDSWGCDVHIIQDIQGNVKRVNVQSCVSDNKAKRNSFRDSIERAVYKASPLPSAPDKGVFNREVLFHFRVN